MQTQKRESETKNINLESPTDQLTSNPLRKRNDIGTCAYDSASLPPPQHTHTHTHTTHTNDMRSSVHIRIEPVHRLFLPRTMTKGMERAATKAAAASTYCTFVQFKKHLSLSLPLSLCVQCRPVQKQNNQPGTSSPTCAPLDHLTWPLTRSAGARGFPAEFIFGNTLYSVDQLNCRILPFVIRARNLNPLKRHLLWPTRCVSKDCEINGKTEESETVTNDRHIDTCNGRPSEAFSHWQWVIRSRIGEFPQNFLPFLLSANSKCWMQFPPILLLTTNRIILTSPGRKAVRL